jgi:FkbM family methyltransferase
MLASCLLSLQQLAATATPSRPCGSNVAFIDLGANDGQSLTWFKRHWAPRSARAFNDVVAFEMNPHFAPVLQALLKPWNGLLMPAAAWTSDGSLSANLQQPGSRTAVKGGVLYNMTASALELGGVPLNRNARTQQRASTAKRQQQEKSQLVPTVDLAAFLKTRYCEADKVDVKMDIEGAVCASLLDA